MQNLRFRIGQYYGVIAPFFVEKLPSSPDNYVVVGAYPVELETCYYGVIGVYPYEGGAEP